MFQHAESSKSGRRKHFLLLCHDNSSIIGRKTDLKDAQPDQNSHRISSFKSQMIKIELLSISIHSDRQELTVSVQQTLNSKVQKFFFKHINYNSFSTNNVVNMLENSHCLTRYGTKELKLIKVSCEYLVLQYAL